MLRPTFTLPLCLLAIVFISGCVEQTEGYVFVDNGTESTMYVEVDGEQVAKIRPGQFEKIALDLGERQFIVKSDGDVIYQASHTLDSGDRPLRRPTYLLNPDGSNRYCEVNVVYGEDQASNRSIEELFNLVSHVESEKEEGHEDEVTRLEWELDRKATAEYRKIKNDMVAFGDDRFFQFDQPSYMLERLPNSVSGSKYSTKAERTTILRVPAKIHDYVRDALEVEEPHADDFEKLLLANEIVQALIPFRN